MRALNFAVLLLLVSNAHAQVGAAFNALSNDDKMLLFKACLFGQGMQFDNPSGQYRCGREFLAKNAAQLAQALQEAKMHPPVAPTVPKRELLQEDVQRIAQQVTKLAASFVPIQGGTFTMGQDSVSRDSNTQYYPAHTVTVASFRMSAKVTVAAWGACKMDDACKSRDGRNNEEGNLFDARPAKDISFNDAQLFIEWLSAKTGHHYQLPSEAQWEYAATVNSGGLKDLEQNKEWMADCAHFNYVGAPSDGTPWTSGHCEMHELRGLTGLDRQRHMSIVFRAPKSNGAKDDYDGFRLVQLD